MSAAPRTPAKPLSTTQGAWLVAERELGSRLRSKSFLISTGILLIAVLAGIIIFGIIGQNTSATPVAATSETASLLEPAGDVYTITEVADREEAETLIEKGEVDAAVLPSDASPAGVLVLADTEAPESLVAALSVAPEVELLNPDPGSNGLRYLLGIAFGVVFMMAAITFGAPITTSVVEEKQTRIIEILLSTVPARALLAGKVVGNTILAIGQIILLIAAAVVGLIVTGQTAILQGFGAPLIWFAVFFLFGFVLLATLFAAAGSLVSRQEDTGPTLTPVMYLTMIPYFLVLFLGDNPLAMGIMSYVPFSAPVAMPIRLFFGEAEWWEPLLSLGVMVVACVLIVLLAAKIYERSLLKMGARVKLSEALKA